MEKKVRGRLRLEDPRPPAAGDPHECGSCGIIEEEDGVDVYRVSC